MVQDKAKLFGEEAVLGAIEKRKVEFCSLTWSAGTSDERVEVKEAMMVGSGGRPALRRVDNVRWKGEGLGWSKMTRHSCACKAFPDESVERYQIDVRQLRHIS